MAPSPPLDFERSLSPAVYRPTKGDLVRHGICVTVAAFRSKTRNENLYQRSKSIPLRSAVRLAHAHGV